MEVKAKRMYRESWPVELGPQDRDKMKDGKAEAWAERGSKSKDGCEHRDVK